MAPRIRTLSGVLQRESVPFCRRPRHRTLSGILQRESFRFNRLPMLLVAGVAVTLALRFRQAVAVVRQFSGILQRESLRFNRLLMHLAGGVAVSGGAQFKNAVRRSGDSVARASSSHEHERDPDPATRTDARVGTGPEALLLMLLVGGVAVTASLGCNARRDPDKGQTGAGGSTQTTEATATPLAMGEGAPPPQLLYLPDGGDVALGAELFPGPTPPPPPESVKGSRCPAEMVPIAGAFCIDRYESALVDARSSEELSPYYPPDPGRAKYLYAHWSKQQRNSDSALGRNTAMPELPDVQIDVAVEPMAVSKANVVPQGYLDANTSARVCERAGKRLCSSSEWVTACRGQENRQFPYGAAYVHGACNIFRDAHPAYLLHGNPSEGHHDPRLNLVHADGGPLLRPTGATPRCRSEWGNDAVYDMVGNLDEWVDDEQGAFHGGFFSRATRLGCDARITTHPRQYSDYSLGTRCCK